MKSIQHNLFSSSWCNPCLLGPTPPTPTEKLLKCLGCKLILYCSPSHQKLDWPIHKKFCKAVGTLLAQNKVKHLFEISGPIRTKDDLSRVTLEIKYKLVLLLGKQLDYHEEELTSFPLMCCVCFSTKYQNLYQCKICNAVSYCSSEHEQIDAPNHESECFQLKLHYCKFKLDSDYDMKLDFKDRCKLLTSDLRTSMASMFGIEFAADASKSLVDYQTFSFVSDFSCIATISYFIEYFRKSKEFREEVAIFIVGSSMDEIWFTPLHTEFLLSCFPEIFKLNMIFIGPEIPESAVEETTTQLENGRHLFRTSFQGTLENYLQSSKCRLKPDLVACFNCGFSENAQIDGPSDSWYKGIQSFLTLPNVPILFTSYTSLEGDNDMKAFEKVIENKKDKVIQLEKILNKHINPYRDMRPLRNWQFNDPERIFFRNGYLQAVRLSSEYDAVLENV